MQVGIRVWTRFSLEFLLNGALVSFHLQFERSLTLHKWNVKVCTIFNLMLSQVVHWGMWILTGAYGQFRVEWVCIGNSMISSDIWHKHHLWYFKIVSNFTRLTAGEITHNNFEISLVVFMPNITTNHAIIYTNCFGKTQYYV